MTTETVPFRQNADGSVTITGHRHPVRISKRRVSIARLYGQETPRPDTCWSCKAKAMYIVSERRGGPELTWITYQCGECGMKEVEPFD